MIFWPSHFSGTVSTSSGPVISGLTDGVAVTGTTLTVLLPGTGATPALQWFLNGAAISGATTTQLVVPNSPGDEITVVVDGVSSEAVLIVETGVVAFAFEGAVLNPGDLIMATFNGAPATAGEVVLTRNGQPLSVSDGQYVITSADVGANFDVRQSDLPSNTAGVVTVVATPTPVLLTAPGNMGGLLAGETRTVDTSDTWQADGAPAAIVLREYRLVVGGVAGAAQASPNLVIPSNSAGQSAQPQLRARTATSAYSSWAAAGVAFTIGAGTAWQITDNGDGTFTLTAAPDPAPAPMVQDNGDGSFSISA